MLRRRPTDVSVFSDVDDQDPAHFYLDLVHLNDDGHRAQAGLIVEALRHTTKQ